MPTLSVKRRQGQLAIEGRGVELRQRGEGVRFDSISERQTAQIKVWKRRGQANAGGDGRAKNSCDFG
jgi:hypothetical protein